MLEYSRKNITEGFPKNTAWQPENILIHNYIKTQLMIYGRTHGRNGVQILLIDNGCTLDTCIYDSGQGNGPISEIQMAAEITQSINLVLEIEEKTERINYTELIPIMKIVRDKCESRFGNKIPNADYECAVFFV